MSRLRVLVVRIGAMGDVLHALPAVAALRLQVPDAEIEWVVDPRWAPLLVGTDKESPVVSRLHLAETRLWSRSPWSRDTLRSILGLRRALQTERFDAIVDMQGTLRSAVVARFAAGAPVSGFIDPREAAARLFYQQKWPRIGTHVVEQGAHLLGQATGQTLAPAAVSLPRDAAADRWVSALLSNRQAARPLAVLAPTAGWGAKQWPAVHFAELARTLASQGWTVLVNAAHPADPVGCEVVRSSDGAATLAPSDLPRLIALLRRADVVVGGDSGPVHLAAALGRPLVALFGPTNPARNGPWGPGPTCVLRHPSSLTSYKRHAATEPGLARVRVDRVLAAIDTLRPAGL